MPTFLDRTVKTRPGAGAALRRLHAVQDAAHQPRRRALLARAEPAGEPRPHLVNCLYKFPHGFGEKYSLSQTTRPSRDSARAARQADDAAGAARGGGGRAGAAPRAQTADADDLRAAHLLGERSGEKWPSLRLASARVPLCSLLRWRPSGCTAVVCEKKGASIVCGSPERCAGTAGGGRVTRCLVCRASTLVIRYTRGHTPYTHTPYTCVSGASARGTHNMRGMDRGRRSSQTFAPYPVCLGLSC
jgi:hypothetical protein